MSVLLRRHLLYFRQCPPTNGRLRFSPPRERANGIKKPQCFAARRRRLVCAVAAMGRKLPKGENAGLGRNSQIPSPFRERHFWMANRHGNVFSPCHALYTGSTGVTFLIFSIRRIFVFSQAAMARLTMNRRK